MTAIPDLETTATTSSAAYAAGTGVSRGGYLAAILLMLAYVMSFVDRQVLVMMIGPIQRDLGINDTQFSLLYGLSFGLFYAIAGLFVGRLVDSGSRVRLIAVAIGLWSIATGLCGLAKGYWQLFTARMAVGIGEAGLSPGAFSLLSDMFRADKRAIAFSIYSAGIYAGTGIAYLVGGRLIDFLESIPPVELPLLGALQSWRLAFLVVGLPGFVLALAIYLLVREPVRGAMETQEVRREAADAATVRELLRHIRLNWRAYLGHNGGFAIHMGFGYAIGSWLPALFMRVHGLSAAQVGTLLGLLWLVFGPLGTMTGGMLARALRARGDASSEMTVGAISCGLIGALTLVLVAVPSLAVAAVLAGLAFYSHSLPAGCNAAALQLITPPRLRGQAAALFMLVGNTLGLGLTPLLVALITDYVFADPQMVGRSLQVVALLTMPLAVVLLYRSRGYFRLKAAAP